MDWSPFWLSLRVAGWATVFSVVVGLAIAYPLARMRARGSNLTSDGGAFRLGLFEGLVNLPLVLPPTVLGYALLVALGRRSALSGIWHSLTGHPLALTFTWQGAVVAACIASVPLFVSHARVAITAVDRDVIDAARTDGAGRAEVFRRILVPLAWPGLMAGTALAFARSLGDFGATLMVAGDTPGMTQTMPLAIYDAVINNDEPVVRTFSLITCLLCLTVSVGASLLTRR
jgi:molybdate transport system permease protein